MKVRYLYLDASGIMRGPLWLSQMRQLFALGRLSKRTQVCPEAENAWDTLENFPEIIASDQDLPDALQITGRSLATGYERRMWRWLALLLTLYVVYAVINFR